MQPSIRRWRIISLLVLAVCSAAAPPPQPETSRIAPRQVASCTAPAVRVLLTSRAQSSLTLQIDGPYRIEAAGKVLAQGERLPATRLVAASGGFRLGKQPLAATVLHIVPAQQPTLWLGNHQYRGSLRVQLSAGKLKAVNVVDLEDYVASVLNGEMPDDFPPAARRAQAIAARTYTLYQAKTFGRGASYDVNADTASQLYQGVQYRAADGRRLAVENSNSREIAGQTRGLVCTYRGRLFCTYYSAICGGRTTHGLAIFPDAAAPLASVPCEGCHGSKYYRWETQVSRRQLDEKLKTYLAGKGATDLRVLPTSRVGWPPAVRVKSPKSTTDITAYDFRMAVGPNTVLSPYFELEQDGANVHLRGRGWGHGVGLCQWGARGQALAGRSTLQILKHYYTGCELTAVE